MPASASLSSSGSSDDAELSRTDGYLPAALEHAPLWRGAGCATADIVPGFPHPFSVKGAALVGNREGETCEFVPIEVPGSLADSRSRRIPKD